MTVDGELVNEHAYNEGPPETHILESYEGVTSISINVGNLDAVASQVSAVNKVIMEFNGSNIILYDKNDTFGHIPNDTKEIFIGEGNTTIRFKVE